jgi:hypothetical protein
MRIPLGEIRLVTSCVLITALCACVSVPTHDVDPVRLSQIKRIALLRIDPPSRMSVFSDALSGDGFVGADIQNNLNNSHQEQFNQAVNERHTPFAATLRDSVRASLEKSGYRVEYLEDEWSLIAVNGKTDADAILSVTYGYTGYKDFGSRFYDPLVTVQVRLSDPKTYELIYYRLFISGYKQDINSAVFIPIEGFHHYYLFSTLMNEFDNAADQLLRGASAIGAAIGPDLQASRGRGAGATALPATAP